MKGTVFSRRLVWVYTIIVMIPVTVFIITATEYLLAGEYRKLIEGAGNSLDANARHITDSVNVFYRIESIIGSNHSITDLIFFTNKEEALPVVTGTRAITDELERLQDSLPQIYGIRIFLSDQRIPERWPIFFHEDRLSLPPEETWQYHYYAAFNMDLMGAAGPPLVSFSNELAFSRRRIGSLQILMRADNFFPFLYTDKSGSRDFVFYRNKAVPGPGGQDELSPVLAESVLKAAAENPAGVLRINGAKRLFVWRAVPGTELLLVRDCPTEGMRRSITVSRIIAGAGIAASTILLFLIIRFATQKMMKRLYIIMDGMKGVREGNLDISLSVEGSDEIAGMGQIFTGMVDRIKTLIAEIEKEQRLVTDTEIRAMQNQINAHFLYNALETIKMQAELRSQDDIVQSITLLGKMLRYCLRWRSSRVSLGEELEYIRAYIALLNIRHDYTIQIRVHIEEPLLEHEIPKMLIQPLVENAFLHAIEPGGEDAVIGISAHADRGAGVIWISVQDFGGGINPEKLKEIESLLASPPPANSPQQSSGGIGLINIQERLTAFYGPAWKIRIKSGEGKGTEVLIPIPLRPASCP